MQRKLFLTLLAIAALLAVFAPAINAQADTNYMVSSVPAPTKAVESVITHAMELLYSRPVHSDIHQRMQALFDTSSPQVKAETEREQASIEADLKQAKADGWEFRSSNVSTNIRSLAINGQSADAVVEVHAEWIWGYVGKGDETPTGSYNIHQLKLVRNGTIWRISSDRNLASEERPDAAAIEAITGPTKQGQEAVTPYSPPSTRYNRSGARYYALAHWDNPNPAYDFYGNLSTGVCTNFTSQSVHEGGGYPFQGSPDMQQWWYDSSRNGQVNVDHSWPWAIANSQAAWMRSNYGDYVRGRDGSPINMALNSSYANPAHVSIGDEFYYDFSGSGYFGHSAIVTGFDANGNPLVTYHNARGHSPQHNYPWHLSGAQTIYALHMYDQI